MSTNRFYAILFYFNKFHYVPEGLGTAFLLEVPLKELLPASFSCNDESYVDFISHVTTAIQRQAAH
jgi:hypothetical protein